jgi:hypothetical protein
MISTIVLLAGLIGSAGHFPLTLHAGPGASVPAYVVRIALPAAEPQVDLPEIAGPDDASRPLSRKRS